MALLADKVIVPEIGVLPVIHPAQPSSDAREPDIHARAADNAALAVHPQGELFVHGEEFVRDVLRNYGGEDLREVRLLDEEVLQLASLPNDV